MARKTLRTKVIRSNVRRAPVVLMFLSIAALIAADIVFDVGLNGFDIVILVVISLYALKGYLRGIVNTVFSLVSHVAGIVGAILLSPALSALIMTHTGLGSALSDRLADALPLLSDIPIAAPDTLDNVSKVGSWLSGLPATQELYTKNPMIAQVLTSAGPSVWEGLTLPAPVSNLNDWMVFSLIRIISVLLLYIVIKLVISVLGKVFTAILSVSAITGTANRLAGMALGALIGVVVVTVIVVFVVPFFGTLGVIQLPNSYHESFFYELIYSMVTISVNSV